MLKPVSHYYGDQVRRLFVAGAVIMAAFLPFYSGVIREPVLMSVIGILILGVAAGLTSPKSALTAVLDTLISLAAIVIFERYAVETYAVAGLTPFFVATQALTILFLSALYYATKTLRGMSKTSQ